MLVIIICDKLFVFNIITTVTLTEFIMVIGARVTNSLLYDQKRIISSSILINLLIIISIIILMNIDISPLLSQYNTIIS